MFDKTKHAVIYHSNEHKKINGTLFYCFEYYAFLKTHIPDIRYVICNASSVDIEWFKRIFKEKYTVNDNVINDIVCVDKRTDIVKLKLSNVLLLDINTYQKVKPFLGAAKSIRIYSNELHDCLNTRANHVFYGFYETYQRFNKKTRLKFYVDIHRTYTVRGEKVFVTSLNSDNDYILGVLNLTREQAFVKNVNAHNANLFENINRMIYWHGPVTDTNNRAVVESYIHSIPLEVHLNGWYSDSIYERTEELKQNGLTDFTLTPYDILIQDFVNDCSIE